MALPPWLTLNRSLWNGNPRQDEATPTILTSRTDSKMTTATGPWLRTLIVLHIAILGAPSGAGLQGHFGTGAVLKVETIRAFQDDVAKTEAKNDQDRTGPNFLWIDEFAKQEKAEDYAKLQRGDVLMRHIVGPNGHSDFSGGLIHDCRFALP